MEVSMRQVCWLLVFVIGCKKGDDDSGAKESEFVPASCLADDAVCASFSTGWSQEEADEVCAELGGTGGSCPEGEVGTCHLEDGRQYILYGLPPLEAENYCDWLYGEWLEPGEVLGEE
jgi:hypothetical protein